MGNLCSNKAEDGNLTVQTGGMDGADLTYKQKQDRKVNALQASDNPHAPTQDIATLIAAVPEISNPHSKQTA